MRRKKNDSAEQSQDRGVLSLSERRSPAGRLGMTILHAVLLILLISASLLPLLWLFKSAITPTRDTLRFPLQLWPNGVKWSTLATAWTRVEINRYFFNTIWVALGSWLTQLVVVSTGAYALSVLRPRYGNMLLSMIVATLFVPGVVILVPLYLTVMKMPILDISLLNKFWGVWLPAGANAFGLVLVKRFFDSLPREIFEAAQVDGAGPFRLFTSIVLPMSTPILSVISIFAIVGA